MANFMYKDRLIIAFATLDETTELWIANVDISWETGSQQHSHKITDGAMRFKSCQDAETFIMEIAKAWVDELR